MSLSKAYSSLSIGYNKKISPNKEDFLNSVPCFQLTQNKPKYKRNLIVHRLKKKYYQSIRQKNPKPLLKYFFKEKRKSKFSKIITSRGTHSNNTKLINEISPNKNNR